MIHKKTEHKHTTHHAHKDHTEQDALKAIEEKELKEIEEAEKGQAVEGTPTKFAVEAPKVVEATLKYSAEHFKDFGEEANKIAALANKVLEDFVKTNGRVVHSTRDDGNWREGHDAKGRQTAILWNIKDIVV